MDKLFYLNELYPFQDQVLKTLSGAETGFYLSGGTALSRVYLNHRFSDDLDLFANDDENFQLWADRYINVLSNSQNWTCQVNQREDRYVRVNVSSKDIALKIEMINDVPSRIGTPWIHPTLGKVDTAENILANKVTAILDRQAPKDFADIWGLCCKKDFPLQTAITGAQGKAAGVFPVDLARVLCSVTKNDWQMVRWIEPPDSEQFIQQLNQLGKSLIFPNEF